MKNLFIITLLTIYGTGVWAQSNNIKLRLYYPTGLELGYESAIQQDKSLLINVKAQLQDFTGYLGLPNGEIFSTNFGYRNYLNGTKAMNGFYIEGEIGIGQAKVSGSRFIGYTAATHYFYPIKVRKYARGTAEVFVGKIGVNLGCQKRWNFFSLDLGVGLKYSARIGGDRSIPLSDGSSLELPKYVNGLSPDAYLGLGIAF